MNKKKWANILLEQEDTTEDLKSKSKDKNKVPQDTAKKEKPKSRNYNIEVPKRLHSERDESLEKFQIKF